MVDVLTSSDIDYTSPIYLTADVNHATVAAVLFQEQNGIAIVTARASRPLTQTEQSLSISERESFSILWALNTFEEFLAGAHTIIVADYTSLNILQ